MTVDPLALRVPAAADEPAHGLMMRLAARHRRSRDVAAFAADCGLSFRTVLRGGSVGAVARLAGLDPVVLGRRSPRVEAATRTVELYGQSLTLGDWSVTERRWCARCLADDARAARERGLPEERVLHHRSWWDVRSIGSCVDHDIPLAKACPACGGNPGWTGPIGRCRCGAPLARDVAAGGGRVGPADRHLHGRLLGSAESVPLLYGLSYRATVGTLERLGLVSLGKWDARKPRAGGEASALRDAGMALAAEGRPGLERALDLILVDGQANGSGRPGLIGAYGWLYETWIADLQDDAFGVTVKDVLRNHAVANGIVPQDEPTLGWEPGRALVDLTTAATVLGMGHRRARRILGGQGLIPDNVRRSVAFPIDRARLARMRGTAVRTTDAVGLRSLLGVGKSQVRRIVEAGLIRASSAEVGDAFLGRRYGVAAVERFLKAMVRGAPVETSPPPGSMNLPGACRSVGLPIERACSALRTGALRPTGRLAGRSSVASVLVRPGDLRKLRGGDRLSVEEAASALGIHHEAVRSLRRLGFIGTVHSARRSLSRRSVDDFRRLYVSATEAACLLGVSPRSAAKLLEGRGLRMAAGPPGCRQIFFLRSDAEVQMGRGLASVATRTRRDRGRPSRDGRRAAPAVRGGDQPMRAAAATRRA